MQTAAPVLKEEILGGLPASGTQDLIPTIQAMVRESHCKLVVLDDDPTGTQTVHGIPVLTDWSLPTLIDELQSELPALFILTNSRSLPSAEAQQLSKEIGENLRSAAETTGMRFAVVSRSDSTLRGHFPNEMEALAHTAAQAIDGWILCPFFQEGGRFTVGDIHYVQEADRLVPAGETEFARDAVFGYRSSRLQQWVEEKTSGSIRAVDTVSVSIEDIRLGGPQRVEEILLNLSDQRVCIVNAADYRDLEIFVLGLLSAEAKGRTFLYRTAASFVRVRAGLAPRTLLSATELHLPAATGGLIIAGSHVPKTTRQLRALLQGGTGIATEEIDVRRLLDEAEQRIVCAQIADRIDRNLAAGKDAVVYTSRKYLAMSSAAASLDAGRTISSGLALILRLMRVRPRFLLAKGGITASVIATDGLHVKRAMVAGQIIAGVPVWLPGDESRYPGIPIIVFPGNVGEGNSLLETVIKLGPA